MIRFPVKMRTFCAALTAAVVLISGCGSKSSTQITSSNSSNTTNILPATLLAEINSGIQQTTARALAGWDWVSFIGNFTTLLAGSSYTLSMQKVTYQSLGGDGNLHSMTGLLILPRSLSSSIPAVPILMFQHGTEPYRPYSPSQFLTHLTSPTDYPEVMVAAAIASSGYAVAMADYEGMGDNTDTQPYLHGATLARQVIDMLRTSRDIIGGTAGNSTSPCKWNGQLFLMGYSEGGFVTLAATRELQLNYASEFTVTASAPLSGPHDLSGTMRDLILSNNTSKAPYYLPFILTAYNYTYGGTTTVFSPTNTMSSPYSGTLPQLFDGKTTSDIINIAMGMSYSTPVTLVVPRSILTQQFITQLSDSNSQAFAQLEENDSYRGWIPSTPIRLFHHVNDDLVPFANSQVAFNNFSTAGAKNWVSLVPETIAITPSSDPKLTIHVAAAFPELADAWQWLNSFKH